MNAQLFSLSAMQEGIWGGVEEDENGVRRLTTAPVRPGYVDCDQQGRLPGCLFEFDNPDDQCRDGRQGHLCGTCAENYGVTLDLQSCQQTPCTPGLVLFILLCVLVVIISLLILLFDLELPNELRGFIFYAQVIGLVYLPYVVVRPSDTTTSAVGILVNLLGFSVPIPLCISENLKAHHIALLGYISPILALITVAGYIFAARFIRPLSNRSALKGITFLTLFIYKYLADTSFVFLSCLDTSFGLVFQYDGSVNCVTWEFGVFALISLALVIFVVLPFPFGVGYICIRRPNRFQHYADVLTKGLKSKHRWFGGWDLGRRLPFVTISFFAVLARPSLLLFFMTLAALVVLIIHLFTKPYKKMYINVIEAAILLDLLMVTTAFLDPPSSSPVPQWFSIILLMLPYTYAVVFIGYKIAVRLWHKFYPMLKPEKQAPSDQLAQTSEIPGTANGNTETRTSTSESDKPTLTTGGVLSDEGGTGSPVKWRQTNDFMGRDKENRFTVLREPLLEL